MKTSRQLEEELLNKKKDSYSMTNPDTSEPIQATENPVASNETSEVKHTKVTDEILEIIDVERSRYKVALALTAYITKQKHEYAIEVLKKLKNELPVKFAPPDDNGFVGGWHIESYIQAVEDFKDDIDAAIAKELEPSIQAAIEAEEEK